jgi:hypothetical protein
MLKFVRSIRNKFVSFLHLIDNNIHRQMLIGSRETFQQGVDTTLPVDNHRSTDLVRSATVITYEHQLEIIFDQQRERETREIFHWGHAFVVFYSIITFDERQQSNDR